MKRAGFTMIELIFVIVILGILAAVALPKFIGVSEQAEAGKCGAFVGTLNRTVGPALWSDSLLNSTTNKGAIIGADAAAKAEKVAEQIDFPKDCIDAAGDGSTNAVFLTSGTTFTFGSGAYDMNFTDGNRTSAPEWTWTKQ